MIDGPICQDETFRHIATGVEYVVINGNSDGVIDTTTLVKIGEGDHSLPCAEGGWVPAIVYYDPAKAGFNFIRDERTFRRNFERA
jgi:hypothetical protein